MSKLIEVTKEVADAFASQGAKVVVKYFIDYERPAERKRSRASCAKAASTACPVTATSCWAPAS